MISRTWSVDHVVNLCFHGIGTSRRALEPGEDRYWVTTERFYEILDEVASWPAVRISFDDGNISDAAIALPALADRGLHADFFALAGRLGTIDSLDAEHLIELRKAGMTIGTHGMAHRSWRGMDPETLNVELVEARRMLSTLIGAPTDYAACPLGNYDRRLLAQLRQLGYTRVFTSDRRWAKRDSWLQPRFSVRCGDTPASLRDEVFAQSGLARGARMAAVGLAKRFR